MSSEQNKSFFDRLVEMYSAAGLPAAIVDGGFTVLWCSDAGNAARPGLAAPDGVRALLGGRDPAEIKAEIKARGAFTTDGSDALFAGRAVTVCALSAGQEDFYLVQPSSFPYQGTGMRPEGVSRTLSSFDAQYRVPLNMIFSTLSLLSQALGRETDPEAAAKTEAYLRAMNQNAFRLLRSCEWVSSYTRLSSGLSPARPERVELYGSLRRLLDAAAETAAPAGVPVFADLPAGMLLTACDIRKVSAVLLNLLSNALRFTRPGNTVAVKVRRHAQLVSVSVSDRGLGIPAAVLPHVFEPYYSYSREGGPFTGNGLGLAIAREEVSLLGGSITLTSTEGEGTTVLFTLPVSEPEDEPYAVESMVSDYLDDRFSPLYIALADSIFCPL